MEDSFNSQRIFLRRIDLRKLGIHVSNTTLLRWEYAGRFPRRIKMAGTSVGWLKSEIVEWINERDNERDRTHYENPF